MTMRDVPLSEPPVIRYAGVGRHGHKAFEQFLLPGLWCLHLFRNEVDLRVGGERFEVTPGTVTVMPPTTPIEYHFVRPIKHVHVFALFEAQGEITPIPAFQQPGPVFERLYSQFEALIGWAPTQIRRSEARLWELLWTVANLGATAPYGDPLVVRAIEIIELRLGEPLTVAGLARQLDVSHNHLTRSFRAATGLAPVEFIRERRVSRAEELLRHTTLPIKAIAGQVGLGDFHSFNKVMRRARGISPRELRRLA